MAGTLTISTLSDGTYSTSATNLVRGAVQAWVNFDSSSGACVVRASYNVSSVTYNATADFTINYTNAMADTYYAIAFSTQRNQTNDTSAGIANIKPLTSGLNASTTSVRISTCNDGGGTFNSPWNTAMIVR